MGLTVQQVLEDARLANPRPEDEYHAAYPYLVRFCAEMRSTAECEFVAIAHMAFGWIATECVLCGGHAGIGKASSAFARARDGDDLPGDDLTHLRNTVCTIAALRRGGKYPGKGGSWVAVSKMLHFVRPDLYAIWDSRVGNYLEDRHWGGRWVDSPQAFRGYTEMCRSLVADEALAGVRDDMQAKLEYDSIGFDLPALRALELVMFLNAPGQKDG